MGLSLLGPLTARRSVGEGHSSPSCRPLLVTHAQNALTPPKSTTLSLQRGLSELFPHTPPFGSATGQDVLENRGFFIQPLLTNPTFPADTRLARDGGLLLNTSTLFTDKIRLKKLPRTHTQMYKEAFTHLCMCNGTPCRW